MPGSRSATSARICVAVATLTRSSDERRNYHWRRHGGVSALSIELRQQHWRAYLVDKRGAKRPSRLYCRRSDEQGLLSSFAANAQNKRSARSDNKCGLLGVRRLRTKWQARIMKDGKAICVGSFDTMEAAHAAYVAAKRQLHEGCTI